MGQASVRRAWTSIPVPLAFLGGYLVSSGTVWSGAFLVFTATVVDFCNYIALDIKSTSIGDHK